MQRMKSFFKQLSARGYYIALGICVLAVAVSGVLYARSLRRPAEELTPESAAQTVLTPTLPQLWSPEQEDPGQDAPVAVIQPKPDRPAPETTQAPTEAPTEEAREPEEVPGKTAEPGKADSPAPPAQTELHPVQPLQGDVAKPFSVDKLSFNLTTRDWRTHAGLDIAAALGSPVRAAADGEVLSVYADDSLGQTVTIRHAGGYVTHYSNLAEEVQVSAGDQVHTGQIIGAVGKTALVEVGSEPHLHFAVFRNNVPQDPEGFLD